MHAVRVDEYAEPPPNALHTKQDKIYIYDTSDRSKQKLPVDVEISLFLTLEMTSDFFRLSDVKGTWSALWPR